VGKHLDAAGELGRRIHQQDHQYDGPSRFELQGLCCLIHDVGVGAHDSRLADWGRRIVFLPANLAKESIQHPHSEIGFVG
jgi:hypothetical protein